MEQTRANIDLVIDCTDPDALGPFWAEALGYRLAGRYEEYVILMPRQAGHPPVLLQQVPEPKTGKARVHLDLRTDDVAGEVARLEALGAHRIDVGQGEGRAWVPMADPEGNEFCVCPGVPLAGGRASADEGAHEAADVAEAEHSAGRAVPPGLSGGRAGGRPED